MLDGNPGPTTHIDAAYSDEQITVYAWLGSLAYAVAVPAPGGGPAGTAIGYR